MPSRLLALGFSAKAAKSAKSAKDLGVSDPDQPSVCNRKDG
jgi:hypothetical protein